MKSRRKTPSLIQSENSEKLQDRFVKPRTSRKRKHETIEACAKIHGATESDKRPTYEKVISFLKSIQVSEVIDMKSEFCGNLGEDEQVEGAFRQLEDFLLELANLYIHVDKVLSKEGSPFFPHFNEAQYYFKVAIGADGAPFGKDDEATAWLLSFINVGERIATHNENFLLTRANQTRQKKTIINNQPHLRKRP